MKITPLEIRQKSFEKGFRGYDKDEVDAYLLSLSQEWERFSDEFKEVKIKLDSAQKEVEKLREVESSLYKTLKTAEDTGANMIDQANRMAEVHMKETEVRSEAILNDAKNKARDTIEEAEMLARQILDEMEDNLKNIVQSYKSLENFRDDLLADIKGLSTDALERVERFKTQKQSINVDEYLMESRREVKKVREKLLPGKGGKTDLPPNNETPPMPVRKDEPKNRQVENTAEEKSFFDEID